jgi:hypothetical protein
VELHTRLKFAQPEIGTSANTIGWFRSFVRRNRMTKIKILGTAVILASALASPAMAQQVISNPGYCAQFYPNANCQNKGPGNPYTGSYQRQTYRDQAYRDQAYREPAYRDNRSWNDSYNRWEDRDTGFWPGAVAAGVVGGAVGTAAAIATAPIGGAEYARRNGFVCIPGTWFRGDDGRQHICQ